MVYVLSKDGEMFASCENLIAEILVHDKRAKVVRHKPYTIQLLLDRIVPSHPPPSCSSSIRSLAKGDPYFQDGKTLIAQPSPFFFCLVPPKDGVGSDIKDWANEHFKQHDILLRWNWDDICKQIPIPDLRDRIETSRKKVFQQFLKQENGCYFNNKKYGVYCIRPYGRTEDLEETPILEMELYTTDYFTHRVMKDVCKTLIKENPNTFDYLRYSNLGISCIFFTSLGINLLLLDNTKQEERHVLLTQRSTNATETYRQSQYSISMTEGVSLADYDQKTQTISMGTAVLRGLEEELGVQSSQVQHCSIRFHDFFVNQHNLEFGLSCSVELKEDITIREHIMQLHGENESMEISRKGAVALDQLEKFTQVNQDNFLPQALHTIQSYLESIRA